jgi:membrane protein implicated in regulation of membrane protease activity
VATTNVPAGEKVVVHGVEGLQLKVDPVYEPQKTAMV